MKNMFSSASTFEAYVQIDYCYFALGELQEKLKENKQPIIQAIDRATGYDKKELQDIKQNTIDLVKCIIKNKKKIQADFSNDEAMLKELLKP